MLAEEERYCVRCGRLWRRQQYACPGLLEDSSRCGATDHGPQVSGRIRPHVPEGPLLGLLGQLCLLPPGCIGVLYGPAGAGKSGLALTAFELAHVTTSEMGPALIVSYARRHGTEISNTSRYGVNEDGTIALNVARALGGWPDVIVDSGTNTGDIAGTIVAAKKYARRFHARALVLAHVRKDGRIRGSTWLEHDPALVVELTRTRLEIKKSRHGPERKFELRRDAQGRHQLRPLTQYYSVEGDDGGALQLVLVPTARTRRAGVYKRKARAKLTLPPPPCAAAAAQSDLYPSGWVEPDDVADRIAYAHAHNVPYFSPVDGLQEVPRGSANAPRRVSTDG